MFTLPRDLRRSLEATVKKARKVAETGARKVIDERLRVGDAKPPGGLAAGELRLRVQLRAHGRQLGDRRDARGAQTTGRLVTECAYEHWHRMLFARFLAETELLIEPESGLPISLADCQELARERSEDWLALASSFAVRMLPKIFRPDDPVLAVALPRETRSALEDLLKSLPRDVFVADDSLGWVYQFWQADEKERVNASGTKIGADELPAVTQLFTEDYMVLFLLHNTLGAWWAGKVLGAVEQASSLAQQDADAHNRDGCAKSSVEQASSLACLTAAAEAAHNRDGCATEAQLRTACRVGDIEWTYLRFLQDSDGRWLPAAGTFDGWPKTAKEITLLDPCVGSGHFLVFALPILVAMRRAEEGLSLPAAVDAVLRDNLHGLEIDPRCTQIAAFNLALAAWKLSGFHELPELQLACSGLTPAASEEDWVKLAEESGLKLTAVSREPILNGLRSLHALFSEAPTLGSLIDPHQLSADLITADYETLKPYLAAALTSEHADDEVHERAVAAAGMVKAAELMAGEYALVITNVPYVGFKKMAPVLETFCETHYSDWMHNLATVTVRRCIQLAASSGRVAVVGPQNWLFLKSYRRMREELLNSVSWNCLAKLGSSAFQTPMWDMSIVLFVSAVQPPSDDQSIACIDAANAKDVQTKSGGLTQLPILEIAQKSQFNNPDARVVFGAVASGTLLEESAISMRGIVAGDLDLWIRLFWEIGQLGTRWQWLQSTFEETDLYAGREHVIDWSTKGRGMLRPGTRNRAYGRLGVCISRMGAIKASVYTGELYDQNCATIVPFRDADLDALWTFCSSDLYGNELRRLDQKLNVTNATLIKVPFDICEWQAVAAEKYPDGLPDPESDDPTQWLFHGRPEASIAPLQVAVARLLGYRWPAEIDVEQASSLASTSDTNTETRHNRDGCATDGVEQASPLASADSLTADTKNNRDGCATGMRLSQRARELAQRCAELRQYADADGIVCLTPVKGEESAADRLNRLLAAAYGDDWSAGKLDTLLKDVGYAGKTLDVWLCDGFFENHCAVFHNRPFIWHIWDGQQNGFHALVNYHRLAGAVEQASPLADNETDGHQRDACAMARRTLEKLMYTYLGDWIDEQRRQQQNGVDGADARLAAAMHLQGELEKILHGEPPYDIFVRWKPLAEQPIGWEPDINDGVRINIRPFMTARPLGARAKNACILRVTPKSVKWDADRGKEPDRGKEDFPWFWSWDEKSEDFAGGDAFDGKRWNGLHYSNKTKQAARGRAAQRELTSAGSERTS